MEVLTQLGICFGVISVIKYLTYLRRDNTKPFDRNYWFKDNVLDYPIQMFVSWLVFTYDHSFIQAIQWVATNIFNTDYQIPHFDESDFYYIVTPVVFTWFTYKYIRKKTTKKVSPKLEY